jgi:threonine synthase
LAPGRGFERGAIAAKDASLWRYAAALALSVPPRISLGKGWTPLVPRRWQSTEVQFKLESQMPTGSFKDRGTAVMINHLLEVGVGPIHEDSSGNAGASLAIYAAAAGLPCRIYVPAAAPRGKLVQIAATGADLCPIPGTRQDVAEAALASSCRPVTAATSSGSTAVSMNSRGAVRSPHGRASSRLRRRIAPLSRRLGRQGRTGLCRLLRNPPSRTGSPPQSPSASPRCCALYAFRRGGVIAVAEAEIAPAVAALGRLGLFVKPTAATAAAALTRLLADGTIGAGQTTVVILTGSGLKAVDRIAELLGIGGAQ